MLTACQVRAARAMLRWPVNELARRSGVSRATIRRIEGVYGTPDALASTLEKIQRAVEAEGILFLADDGKPEGGPGVRYGRYPGRKAPGG